MENEQMLLSIDNGELENGHHRNPEPEESLQEKKNELLIKGIELGNVRMVRTMVRKGADINHVIKGTNKTPIMHVMHLSTTPPQNYRRIIMILLEAGANAYTRNEDGLTILHIAARCKDLRLAKLAVNCGISVDTFSNSGRTALGFAIQSWPNAPSFSAVKLLLELGANVNLMNDDGDTVLHRISEAPFEEGDQIMELLIDRGIDVNCKNYAGNTPLLVAALQNDIDGVEILSNCGACDFTIKSCEGETALHITVKKNNLRCALILLNAGCNVDDKMNSLEKLTALHVAAAQGHDEVFFHLLGFKPDLSSLTHSQHTILHSAVVGGSTEIVKTLLQLNINVNAQANNGNTPTHFAVQMKRVTIMKLLLNYNVDLNIKNKHGQTPLHLSSLIGTVAMTKLLVKNGADVTTRCNNNTSILQAAFYSGNKEVFKFLLSPQCKPVFEECNLLRKSADNRQRLWIMNELISDQFNSRVESCEVKRRLSRLLIRRRCPELIYLAAEDGLLNIVNLTTDDGYDVNQLVGGRNFLDAAMTSKSADIVRLLLSRGCLPNDSNSEHFNALHRAAWKKNRAMTELLLEFGANVNLLSNCHKNTALHYAVERYSKEGMLITLFAYGADLHVINDQNCTPLTSSLMRSYWMTIHLLKFEAIAYERGHILPMHEQLFMNRMNLRLVYEDCLREIAITKTYFIHPWLSVWDLLWKPIPSLIPFLNFSMVRNFMENNDIYKIFEHYSPLIYYKLKRAMDSKVNHNKAHQHLMEIMNLPSHIVDHILSYLSAGEKKLLHHRLVH